MSVGALARGAADHAADSRESGEREGIAIGRVDGVCVNCTVRIRALEKYGVDLDI